MWKKKQYVGFSWILGLTLISLSIPSSHAIVFSANPPGDTPDNATTLQSSSGELDNEPWNVHPNYRWDTDEDLFDSTVENSQFQLNTVINDTQESAFYYREASSMDDKTRTRWMLNSSADAISNEIDFALVNDQYGVATDYGYDGWTFDDETYDTWTGLNNMDATDGELVGRVAAGGSDDLEIASINPCDSDIWNYLIARIKTNRTEITIYPDDGDGNRIGVTVYPTTTYAIYEWDLTDYAAWSDDNELFFHIDEDDDTLEGNEGVWFDYILLSGVSQYQGDYQVQLAGLNSTTQDGDAFLSMNAFPFNASHYVIRPSVSTSDGSNNRSWYMDADYQDYGQMTGEWGTDGWDFTEGLDGFSDTSNPGESIENGYFYTAGAATCNIYSQSGITFDTDVFQYLSLKIKTNETLSGLLSFRIYLGSDLIGGHNLISTTNWQTYIIDASQDADWTGDGGRLRFYFTQSGAGFGSPVHLDIDYIRLTNEPYALESFEYLTYFEHLNGLYGHTEVNGATLTENPNYLGVEGGAFDGFDVNLQLDVSNTNAPTLEFTCQANDTGTFYVDFRLDGASENLTTITFDTTLQSFSLATNESFDTIRFYRGASMGAGYQINFTSISLDYSSDSSFNGIDLYEYDTYYRLQMDFDLRASDLEFEIYYDNETRIVEELLGDFALWDYFDYYDLLFDIWLSEVGLIDHTFGLLNAGANTTVAWDFYEADFMDYTWKTDTLAGVAFNSTSPYISALLDYEADGNAGSINYSLCVSEFDSCSGRFIEEELVDAADMACEMEIAIHSKNPSTGVLTKEGYIRLYTTFAAGGTAYVRDSDLGTIYSAEASNNEVDWGELAYSIYYDKYNRKITFRVESFDTNSEKTQIAMTCDVAAGQSNEFILEMTYGFNTQAHALTAIEAYLIHEDFDLVFRDNLLPDPVSPDIDLVGGAVDGLTDLFAELFRMLLGPLLALLDLLKNVPDLLSDILVDLSDIAGEVPIIGDALSDILDEVSGLLAAIQDVVDAVTDVEGAVDLVTTAVNSVTTAVGLIASQIMTAFINEMQPILQEIATFIWDDLVDPILGDLVTWIRSLSFEGVTIGEIIDVVDLWANQFFSNLGDTLEFLTMLLTTWLSVLLILILCFGMLNAASRSKTGADFYAYMGSFLMININFLKILPFFDFDVPLGAILLPNLFFVVFASYSWVEFFTFVLPVVMG